MSDILERARKAVPDGFDLTPLDQLVRDMAAEIASLSASEAQLLAALYRIEASCSCFCAKDTDGRRLGTKCATCEAQRAIANAEKGT